MPKQQIVAGEPDMGKVIPEEDTSKEDTEQMQHDHSQHGHGDSHGSNH